MRIQATINRLVRDHGDAAMALAGLALLIAVLAASNMPSPSRGEALTRDTIRLALAWYGVALILMMRLDANDWRGRKIRGRVARWCWTWGVICFLVHLAMAFHFYHHWSHAHAFEHTRQISGIGEGIYVSYLFTWLWISDVLWWWTQPERYAQRAAWFDRALHAFMLFIVFNGMVVFEAGVIRWAGFGMFFFLAIAWRAAAAPAELRRA
jgi:hypothetical protein